MFKKMMLMLLPGVLLLIASCQQNGQRDVQQYTIEQFLNTTSIFGSSFSHDESKVLYTSDATGIYNAYSIPVDGGEARQLSDSDSNSVFITAYFPNDDRMLLRSDQGGNEIWHIYLREKDGTVRDLTPFENARALFAGWNRSLDGFYFVSNKRNPKYMDLYEMDIQSFEADLLFKNEQGYNIGDVSNDKRYLSLSKTITRDNSEMYLYDFQTGELKHISEHEGDINYRPLTFSNDSKTLYFLTDENSEFNYLKSYNVTTGDTATVAKADWDIMYAYFSWDGKYRVLGINQDARTEIRVKNMITGEPVDLPEMPNAEITSVNISRSENLMAFYVNGSRSPSNLYVYNFDTGKYIKLTDSMSPEIDPRDLVDAEVIRYESYDGLEIPALLYKPHQLGNNEKGPGLIWVHGGPGGQSRVGYRASIQYLVNHGYTILAVNNRGSSGYGKTFYQLDDKRHGQDDLDDCVWGKKYLVSAALSEEDEVGIIGGSYGGYMVLAALTFRPEEFAVGVDLFGISNWLRTLESIPAWWESQRNALYREMGNPETEREMLLAKSPLFHAEKIQKPLMVLQGANDPRVLKVESDEIVEAVKKNNVPVEYVLFEDEGHGFLKKANRIEGYKAILEFLNQYLKQKPEA